MTQYDHWDGRTIDFMKNYLIEAEQMIRIATGFFSVQGYSKIMKYISNVIMLIIVGYDETSKERLRDKLVEDIMDYLRRWDDENRREAVIDLVEKLKNRQFYIVERDDLEFIDARIKKKDHAKVYIIDDRVVIVGSANLSQSGLISNEEAVTSVISPEQVQYWITRFEKYWHDPNTIDLTQDLLELLLRWLDLVPPFDIYLRAIHALVPEDLTELPRSTYKMPVEYQRVVIERMLRQLEEYRGSFLVASTGLGKTIMATHAAYRLQQAGKIRNVVVFAPKQISFEWEDGFMSAGISAKVFTRDLLDQPQGTNTHEVNRIIRMLDNIDDQYLIIIDESQYFRNKERNTGTEDRRSITRLIEAVRDNRPYVILLTATPFGKAVQDINTQLLLLPHTGPTRRYSNVGQGVLFGDMLDYPNAWQIVENESSFNTFMELPVSTVISTSRVAKDFALQKPQGLAVDFGGHYRWVPQIELRKVTVPLVLEQEISQLLEDKYFRHQRIHFRTRDGWQSSEQTVEEELNISWASSPRAVVEVVKKMINGEYKVEFLRRQEEIENALVPLLDELEIEINTGDDKFKALKILLEEYSEHNSKIIVFTERLATALYLENRLAKEMPVLQIANIVRQTSTGETLLKEESEIDQILVDFAPEANFDKDTKPSGKSYDILITTDALGAGVNLQDANIVINYDLAWTPDTIVQRAGRILRFWKEPRRVTLIIIVGAYQYWRQGVIATRRVEERLTTLTERTRYAERFSEVPIIPDEEQSIITNLADLSQVTIENLGVVEIEEVEEFTGVSPFLIHIRELKLHEHRIQTIPDDISSALSYRGDSDRMYLLFRYQRQYAWTLYNVDTHKLENITEDNLLDLIRCSEDTPIAAINPDDLEYHAQAAKRMWCQQNNIQESDSVERICALYMLPERGAN